jgi:hypothetical protein
MIKINPSRFKKTNTMNTIKVLISTLTLFSLINCNTQDFERKKDKVFNQNFYMNESEIVDYIEYVDNSRIVSELKSNIRSIVEFSIKKTKSNYSYPRTKKKYNKQGKLTEYLYLSKSKDTLDYYKYTYVKDTIKSWHNEESVVSIYKDLKLIYSEIRKNNTYSDYKIDYNYDDLDRLIESKQYITSNNKKKHNLLKHYIYKYNENEILKFQINSSINNKQDTTLSKTFLFDNNGRMKKEIIGKMFPEVIEERIYDINGNIIENITNKLGGKITYKNTYKANLLLTTNVYNSNGLERKLEYEYDNDGNLITLKSYIADVLRTYPLRLSYTYEYDRKGNLIDMHYKLRNLVVHREIKYW